jgi:hypothetical protein
MRETMLLLELVFHSERQFCVAGLELRQFGAQENAKRLPGKNLFSEVE